MRCKAEIRWDDMVGKIEYTDSGRYEIVPVASLFYELIGPWIFNLPFIDQHSIYCFWGRLNKYHVELGDYSLQAPVYKFMQTTPKISMRAGPPDLMDDELNFWPAQSFRHVQALPHVVQAVLGFDREKNL